MEFHPVADLFPMMSEEEFNNLVASIEVNGIREPVWLHNDGRIVDGRNRYMACRELGVTPPTRVFEGEDDALLKFVLDLNLHRRHLNASQRAMVAAKLASFSWGGDRVSEQAANLPLATQQEAAEQLNVGERSVRDARQVQQHGTPDMIADVESGNLAVSKAADIVKEADKEPERVDELYKKTAHVAHNSGDNEWYTPSEYLDAARRTLGTIDLDPATSAIANEKVGAIQIYTEQDNGLVQPWKGKVWMNPPYAHPLIRQFSEKLVEEFNAGNVTEAIVLVNNATETEWFQLMTDVASAVCFPKGRIKFWHPDKVSAPLQGQAVIYLGASPEKFAAAHAGFGFVAVIGGQ